MRKLLLHPAALVFLLYGCGRMEDRRVDHVARIYMHDAGEYTLFVRDPSSGELRAEKFHVTSAVLVEDVPPEGEMWAVHRRHSSGCAEDRLTIHLHAVKDVNAADWQRREGVGPTRRTVEGTTEVIE